MTPACLKCVICGKEFSASARNYTCGVCGQDGTLDVIYDLKAAGKNLSVKSLSMNNDRSMWRYSDILPVENTKNIPALSVGFTPLYRSAKFEREYNVSEFYIKDDGRNPTGSLKDRASALCVAKALDIMDETGAAEPPVIACASTGNAASSLAGFAAVSGIAAYIFVPRNAPAAKVTQLLVYGANVVLVEGDYGDAYDLAAAAIGHFGWYNRNCAINPYLVEGKKTCALEIAEQLNWNVPDRIYISVGDGCCISSLYKGFSDLLELGFIERLPKITGVQAEGAAPIYKAFAENSDKVVFTSAHTLADSISVGSPKNWAKALRAVSRSGGEFLTVSDADITSAIPELARGSGVFAEPAGAAAFAGFRRMARDGKLKNSERVAVVVTGNGLKDIEGAQKSVGKARSCVPDINAFLKLNF
ncbi:MAG: threonine synthase [Synergistaceae bacterium]|nr:threonine synthase [Synergistaceae bacterium]